VTTLSDCDYITPFDGTFLSSVVLLLTSSSLLEINLFTNMPHESEYYGLESNLESIPTRWLFLSSHELDKGLFRVADPDPDWIRIQSGQWIWIRNPDPDPGGQK
jgi:hypothetical protein